MLQVLEFRMVTQAARERVSLTAFTLTTPLFWYSFQFASSELNRSLYDVTHWISMVQGLPCVAILFTTLSFPRSICKYSPIAFWRVHQTPAYPLVSTLLRRACHGMVRDLKYEDAFTASFGISPFSIPRGWMRHSVGRNTNSFLFSFTCWRNSNQVYKGQGFECRWRYVKNFQVHIRKNRWDCPASVRIISSIHLSTAHGNTCMSLRNWPAQIWVASCKAQLARTLHWHRRGHGVKTPKKFADGQMRQ